MLQRAQAARSQGCPHEVIRVLSSDAPVVEDSLRTEPSLELDRLVLLGIAYHDIGRPLEAADALERASLIGPIADEARIALASSYAELRRIDLARELYLQLALSRRLSSELMLQVAAGLAAIDAPQLAMQVCEWITENDDGVAQAYYDMGVYSASSGNQLYLTEALTRRALELDSANVHYRIGLVSLLIQLRREDEALAALDETTLEQIQAIECSPCLARIAALLSRHRKTRLARACVRRLADLEAAEADRAVALNGGRWR